jgi:hypothetical protein
MQLIDTHAHIYLPDFKDFIDEVLSQAAAAGVGGGGNLFARH